jgi:hypothetical protein
MLKRTAATSFAATPLNLCILSEFFIGPLTLRVGHPLSAVLRSAFRAYMIRALRESEDRESVAHTLDLLDYFLWL